MSSSAETSRAPMPHAMPPKAPDLAEKLAKFATTPDQQVYIKWWRVTDYDPALVTLGGVVTLTPGISDGVEQGFIYLWDSAAKTRRTSVSEETVLDVQFFAPGEPIDDATVRKLAGTPEELPPAA